MSNTPGALIAMSGGVDSTVAAYLMKQAGCRCMGATMRLYQNEDLGQSGFHTCCSAKDVEDAAEVGGVGQGGGQDEVLSPAQGQGAYKGPQQKPRRPAQLAPRRPAQSGGGHKL